MIGDESGEEPLRRSVHIIMISQSARIMAATFIAGGVALAFWGQSAPSKITGDGAKDVSITPDAPRRSPPQSPPRAADLAALPSRGSGDGARTASIPIPEVAQPELEMQGMNAREISALESSLAVRYDGATQFDLIKSYKMLFEQIPNDEVILLHELRLGDGEFESLREASDQSKSKPFHMSGALLASNQPIVTRTHMRPDGLVARTHIDPADMPGYEPEIRELIWIMGKQRHGR